MIRSTLEEPGSQGCKGHGSSFNGRSLLTNWAFFFFLIRDQLLNNIFFAKMLIPSSAALAAGSSNKEPGVPSLPQVLSSTQVTYASAECGLKNIATNTK